MKLNIEIEKILRNVFIVFTIVSFSAAIWYSIVVLKLLNPQLINIILILPFLFFVPFLAMGLYRVKRISMKMKIVPRFLRDIVDNVESGMDLVSSIKNTSNTEYGVLNVDIKKIVNQLSWGIEFDVAFMNFAKNIGSEALQRDFLLVIEARNIGGHVDKILRELSHKITKENMRENDRKSNLSSNTFTGYISFIIFIFIIIIVYNNLFLGLLPASDNGAEQDSSFLSIYLTLFIFLSYEIAILSGFLFGMMQENNIINGGPHVVLLAFLVFLGFRLFI